MFWRLFSVQALLDALFDDGWLCLSLTLDGERREPQDANLQAPQV